ncbi:MAG: hypothetical protein R3274_04295 [Desulfobacterales bacterium]|nr:hypothetical protein [Desulfobacterales bacterium]
MTKDEISQKAALEECIEDCYQASKLCYEKADGTPVCPFDYKKCADDCHKRYSC